MTTTIKNASWDVIQALRSDIESQLKATPTLQRSSQLFVEMFTRWFDTVALARVFLVVPYCELPEEERAAARGVAIKLGRAPVIDDRTPVLTLLGTSGSVPAWNHREKSAAHRAIPLLDRSFIDGAPMISALLSSLSRDIEKGRVDDDVHVRLLAGGLNARFYVPDSRTTVDAKGRHIIADATFVEKHTIRTVFGMGGAYLSGAVIVAVVFTKELLPELHVERFPSFIGTFKMATAHLVQDGKIFG